MPTIVNGSKEMQAVLYTGTGATQTISGLNFQPDFVWIKSRSNALDHKLTDSVRGATKGLISNATSAETTDTNGVTAFTSTGFTLGSDSVYNTNGATYVAWCWKAGQGTTSSNTSGSITSTVSVNASAGFSVITYTGTATNATVGHSLGVVPKLIIVKNRTTTTNGWATYHASSGATGHLALNETSAFLTSTLWNNTAPTSSVFSVGTSGAVNGSTNAMVAYCWAEVAGFSKAFSYTGNGSTDGSFVYLGFRPKFVMIKRTDASEQWYINDTSRDTYNLTGKSLRAQDSGAEASTSGANSSTWDILSNGFKLRDAGGGTNASGGSYIGIAFAENPFKNSLAR